MKGLSLWASLCLALAAGGCAAVTPAPQAPADAAAVESAVRSFMAKVAHDVTQEGPVAWGTVFSDGPSFFMAVDGQLVFPTGAAARAALPEVARSIPHIELVFGQDLRIDVLTASLAVVATSWHEVRVDAAGHRADEKGFFTGTAEYREGRWQLRNAHWSDPRPASP
jgi:hypothetical protein